MKTTGAWYPDRVEACLFDLDGVLTPTAEIHRRAWSELFEEAFARQPEPVCPYDDDDYFALVDGRPRYEGVRAVLASRGIDLDWGDPSDPGSFDTICAMGNLKDSLFLEQVSSRGVSAYPGSVLFLDAVMGTGWKVGVVSASQNARTILDAAGILDRFEVVVDGHVTAELGLAGKPSPDTYLEGARRLGVEPGCTIIVEDALGGVEAGRAGGFASVVGVDRGAGAQALRTHGATIVVDDLAQLLPLSPRQTPSSATPMSSCPTVQDLGTPDHHPTPSSCPTVQDPPTRPPKEES